MLLLLPKSLNCLTAKMISEHLATVKIGQCKL